MSHGGTKAPPYESNEITATVRRTGEKHPPIQSTNPRYGQSPQERGILKGERIGEKFGSMLF